MSIAVYLKKILNLPGKYDRKVELSFRGKKLKGHLMCMSVFLLTGCILMLFMCDVNVFSKSCIFKKKK